MEDARITTADQRRKAIAEILARGVRRLLEGRPAPPEDPTPAPKRNRRHEAQPETDGNAPV